MGPLQLQLLGTAAHRQIRSPMRLPPVETTWRTHRPPVTHFMVFTPHGPAGCTGLVAFRSYVSHRRNPCTMFGNHHQLKYSTRACSCRVLATSLSYCILHYYQVEDHYHAAFPFLPTIQDLEPQFTTEPTRALTCLTRQVAVLPPPPFPSCCQPTIVRQRHRSRSGKRMCAE